MDTVHRFLFEDLDIRGALVQLGPAWHQLQAVRDYEAPVRRLLGELAAVTTIIGCNLKQPGRLSFHLRGEGAVRLLVMECDEQLRLRGLAKIADAVPLEPTFSDRDLLGTGQLVLTLQTNAAAEHPYQSYVPLEGDNLAAIFEHYLAQSEQAPARLWLAADEHHACALFLQKLPNADKRDPDGWNRVQHLAATLKPVDLALPPETLLTRVFPEETLRLFDAQPVSYHCPRDEEKVIDMLRALGRDEVEAALADTGAISIHDDICNHEYRFGREVLEHLFDEPPAAPHTLH
ncbi:Hsp33 family molecular chaperone HslO [Sulfurisoma sediminicola]|uniref:Molecular chaperone Hsp33 n=1 Tax=Sulfurisoma sediminicola TaxID=1381557 RepID=A0A497XEW3_9PROT|nr:Hsp33 family molecular chaperone HslO [Sulfurisoma sediminicola]RLJ65254.1 molecular chaperone Hsp33 [Sulfurisoma sediminicola]